MKLLLLLCYNPPRGFQNQNNSFRNSLVVPVLTRFAMVAVLEFNEAGSIQVSCPECGESGFHQQLGQLRIAGVSLLDVWDVTIEKVIPVYEGFHLSALNILKTANLLFLGHLHLDQRTSTLSGGENIRVKLLKAYRSRVAILGIDEQFRGLDRIEQSRMLDFLSRLTATGKPFSSLITQKA